MCLDESGYATGLVLCGITCFTHFIHANDVCDILLNYYSTSYKVQKLYYNATMLQYDISVAAGHAIGSADFKACVAAR